MMADEREPTPGDNGASIVELLTPEADAGRSVQVGEDLAAALRRARYVQPQQDAVDVSFTSLLLALSLGEMRMAVWLRDALNRAQALPELLRRLKSDVLRYEEASKVDAGRLPFPRSFSASAIRAIELGEQAAHPRRIIEPADVLLAMLSTHDYHAEDFRALGIDRQAWVRELQAVLSAAAQTAGPVAPKPVPPATSAATAEDPLTHPRRMEGHVFATLRIAAALAGDEPISPVHLLTVIRARVQAKSPAFDRLRQLLPPEPNVTLPEGAELQGATFAPALRAQLERALRPLPTDGQSRLIWGRDLVTAALLCPDELVQPAVPGGLDALGRVRDAWYRFVVADTLSRPPSDWAVWWQEAGVPLPEQPRAGYAVETDEGDDHLGIGPEASAFARLILDKDVKPPLSIGLLGDWGSGKSFFIEEIKRQIGALLEEQRPELHASVVQIEFNAWHASDANLWASLVTNIFDEIWRTVSATDEKVTPAEARARLSEQIKLARGAVHEAQAEVETGRFALAQAEEEFQHKQALLALQQAVSTRVAALAQAAGWHAPIQTIHDVDQAARALLGSGQRLRQTGAALLERPALRIGLPVLACLGLAGLGLGWLDDAGLNAWQQRVSQVLTAVAGLVGSVIAPLKLAKAKVDTLTRTLAQVQTEFDERLARLKASDDPRSHAEAHSLERARREVESSEQRVKVARAHLAELMNQQVALDPTHRLGSFLQERVQSGPYRAQQGIISLVHKDFSELSQYMKRLREAPADPPPAPDDLTPEGVKPRVKIKPIDRIVLYVDDLDRCRPAQVVAMLEAVHLLLALDLFVVVVAVDSRWLTRALEVHYSELLGTRPDAERDDLRESTPQNYLEKIFQITYALAPMRATHLREYVDTLAGDKPPPQVPAPAPSTTSTPAPVPAPTTAAAGGTAPAAAPTPTGPADPAERPASPPPPAGAASPATMPKPPRTAQPITIGPDERALIVALAPLLGTPRLTKRLVNVYRVIKSSKSGADLEAFENGRRATPCLVLLAILFGRPLIANALLRGIHEGSAPFDVRGRPLREALADCANTPHQPPRQRQAWQEAADLLQALGIHRTIGDFADEPEEVARYSLASGHEWHTWRRPNPSGSRAAAATR